MNLKKKKKKITDDVRTIDYGRIHKNSIEYIVKIVVPIDRYSTDFLFHKIYFFPLVIQRLIQKITLNL